MGKKPASGKTKRSTPDPHAVPPSVPEQPPHAPGRPSALLDTRVIYCGDCLEQLKNLPDACVDLVGPTSRHLGIDPPFSTSRTRHVELAGLERECLWEPEVD